MPEFPRVAIEKARPLIAVGKERIKYGQLRRQYGSGNLSPKELVSRVGELHYRSIPELWDAPVPRVRKIKVPAKITRIGERVVASLFPRMKEIRLRAGRTGVRMSRTYGSEKYEQVLRKIDAEALVYHYSEQGWNQELKGRVQKILASEGISRRDHRAIIEAVKDWKFLNLTAWTLYPHMPQYVITKKARL
ncbi:MAG: hypothetical protein V1708_02100 [Candidatus Micrarchaeota archaeon]